MDLLNKQQIEDLIICGKILKNALDKTVLAVKAGVSASKLDRIAEKAIVDGGARPSFKNYFIEGVGSYPASLCVSINEEVVHGIPTEHKIIRDGDVVSLDLGAEYKGVYTDMATTVVVGKVAIEIEILVETTRKCLESGLSVVKTGAHIGDIGEAVEKAAKEKGLGVIRDFVGHGIGTHPHSEPKIPNYGKSGKGPEIVEGMALAIEPMITLGAEYTYFHDDGWTAKTKDHSIAAHFEHTIVISDGKPIVVTR